MDEKAFALAIATEYITAWFKFTQASIARWVRLVVENGHGAAIARDVYLPARRNHLERTLPQQFEAMKRQIRDGEETQVRQVVESIRKEKIWEKEHGFDDDGLGGGSADEYRHLIPWMKGARVNSPHAVEQGDGNDYSSAWPW